MLISEANGTHTHSTHVCSRLCNSSAVAGRNGIGHSCGICIQQDACLSEQAGEQSEEELGDHAVADAVCGVRDDI